MNPTCAVAVACHVIPASGRLVAVDILELFESPCSGVGICYIIMGQMVNEGIRPDTS